jgi:hypothetical protein
MSGHEGEGLSAITCGPSCPCCGGGDNTAYIDANGMAMRACGRCMIQWRDPLRTPTALPASPATGDADLAVELCRELYDRFMMGGWEPQDAHDYVRSALAEHTRELRERQHKLKPIIEKLKNWQLEKEYEAGALHSLALEMERVLAGGKS